MKLTQEKNPLRRRAFGAVAAAGLALAGPAYAGDARVEACLRDGKASFVQEAQKMSRELEGTCPKGARVLYHDAMNGLPVMSKPTTLECRKAILAGEQKLSRLGNQMISSCMSGQQVSSR